MSKACNVAHTRSIFNGVDAFKTKRLVYEYSRCDANHDFPGSNLGRQIGNPTLYHIAIKADDGIDFQPW